MIKIEDKFDLDSLDEIILLGYPANKQYILELMSWSCFANDPVGLVSFPYLQSLSDEILLNHIPDFIEFHINNNQSELIKSFVLSINEGRKADFMKQLEKRLFESKKIELNKVI